MQCFKYPGITHIKLILSEMDMGLHKKVFFLSSESKKMSITALSLEILNVKKGTLYCRH